MGNELVAKIALAAATYPIDKPYDYLVPEALRSRISVGMRVMVPFGRGNRRSEGMILALSGDTRIERMKSVLSLLDEEPVLDEAGIRLAIWMRDRWFCTLYDAIKAILPAGLWFSLRDVYRVADGLDREAALEAAGDSPACSHVLDYLFSSGGRADSGRFRRRSGILIFHRCSASL